MSTTCSKTTTIILRSFQGENEKLISRAQAKNLVARFGESKVIVLDFAGVNEIGQAFSDEVFRVFQKAHSETKLVPVNMTTAVKDMVSRARAG